MKRPLVSIIIPVYNGSNYLRQAIDSALNQTYDRIEIVVVNDGSCDNGATETIARSYGDKIRYFEKLNGGVSSALNLGIANMRGDYFSWLSHDDLYESDKIERQVEALQNVDGKTLICCDYAQIDAEGKLLNGFKPAISFRPGRIYTWQETLKGLLQKSVVHGCGLLIPKSAFDSCGGFDESLRFLQDTVMWYTIFLRGYSLLCTSDVSVKGRIHGNQLTQTSQELFRKDCAAVSDYLVREFLAVSNREYNFLRWYLYSDAINLPKEKIQKILQLGRQNMLLSTYDILKVYLLYGYGKIRPVVRKIYYRLFRKMKTK